MKKLSISFLGILIIIALLIGCSSKATTSTTTSPPLITSSSPSSSLPASIINSPIVTAISSGTPTPTTGPKKGGTFTIIDPRPPTGNIGWFHEASFTGGLYVAPMADSLLDVDLNGKIMPKLAIGWEVAPDKSSITLKLRKGVKFHDGTDFNAAACKWNLEQMIINKRSAAATWASIDIIDEYTVRINLKQWLNKLFNDLGSTYMVSPTAYETKGGAEYLRWNPVSIGPFKFQKYVTDTSITYTKFADYWDAGKPYLDSIVMQFIIDPMTKYAAFLSGAADATGGDLGKVEYDLQQQGFEVVKCTSGVIYVMGDSKNAKSPFRDIRVREALDYAIDRDAIVKAKGYGFQQPVYQYGIPGTPSYINDLPIRKYNPAKAKELLEAAGYPSGFKTKLIANSAVVDRDAAVLVQSYLAAVGINTELLYVDQSTWTNYRVNGWEGILYAATGVFTNVNQGIIFYWNPANPYFPSAIIPDELTELYKKSSSSVEYDPELVKPMIRCIFDNAMYVPLYTVSRGHVLKPYVRDTGLYTMQTWPGWLPANAWLDK